MNWRKPHTKLDIGSEVLELLLPHRRPFLLVDHIDAFVSDPTPAIRTRRHISSNEAIFEGHFPKLHLWPGVYTIEGMGQTCQLLHVLAEFQSAWQRDGRDAAEALDLLRNLHAGYRLDPSFDPAKSQHLVGMLREQASFMGFVAAVNVKLQLPVFAGQTIFYEVSVEHFVGQMARFQVAAIVNNRTVARGTMTNHRSTASLPHLFADGGESEPV